MYFLTKALINSLPVIIGTLIGGLISIISQYLFSKRQENKQKRKILASKINEIMDYNNNLNRAISQLIHFISLDIPDDRFDDEIIEGLNNIMKSIYNFANICILNKKDYLKLIYIFFSKITKNKKFRSFEILIEELDNLHETEENYKFTDIIPDVIKNKQEYYKSRSEIFYEAKEINDLIKDEYLKFFRK